MEQNYDGGMVKINYEALQSISSSLTYGDIMREFSKQFPGLTTDDMRPNGPNQLYIWTRGHGSPTNMIATYFPTTNTFQVQTTYKEWGE